MLAATKKKKSPGVQGGYDAGAFESKVDMEFNPARWVSQFMRAEDLESSHKYLLLLMASLCETNGWWSPNITEVAGLMGVARSSVHRWLREIVALGWLIESDAEGTAWRRGASTYWAAVPGGDDTE